MATALIMPLYYDSLVELALEGTIVNYACFSTGIVV